MNEKENTIFKIINNWTKKKGFFLSSALFITIYFPFIKPILKDDYFDIFNRDQINFFFPLLAVVIIFIIWLITSNRIALFRTGDIRIGLVFNLDDESFENNLKTISKNLVEELKQKHKNIKVILYPINFSKSKENLKKYIKNHQYSIDSIIYLKINTGNKRGVEGEVENNLEINEITFFGKFNVNEKLKIFKTSIRLSDELKIRNLNKNWSYVESNSFNDKRKIHDNLNDVILFYSGMYLIYERKVKAALNILKTLHSQKDSTAELISGTKEIKGNKNFISASRLNEILLNLFISNATISYTNLDNQDAYNSLKECEKIFPNHPQSFEHFISLARFSYDLGNLEEAIDYTIKAKNIKKFSTEIYLNEGFFGILKEDENEICYNYNQLRKVHIHKHSTINFTEVIAWLNDERKKNNNNLLFDFLTGTLNYLYSDKILGKKTLLKTYNNSDFSLKYPMVYILCHKILTDGDIKSTYFNIRNVKSKKNKRKKKNK